MAKKGMKYPAEFRRQMVELVWAGRKYGSYPKSSGAWAPVSPHARTLIRHHDVPQPGREAMAGIGGLLMCLGFRTQTVGDPLRGVRILRGVETSGMTGFDN